MKWLNIFVDRLRALVQRDSVIEDIEEEMHCHVEMETQTNIARGMSPDEARRAALRSFGNLGRIRDLAYEVRGAGMLETLWQDLRYGARILRRSPLLSLVAVFSLAAGIGLNTAIFSVVNALLLRPLPYRAPEQLVKVFQAQPDSAKGSLPSSWSYPRFEVLRDQNQSFVAVAGYAQNPYNLTGTDSPERLQIEMVSASYFPLLGVDALIGRSFVAEEDHTPETNLAVLLSYGLWQRRFGGQAQVIGKTIELEKQAFTVVGVLPQGFRGQSGTADVWVTMMAAPLLRYKRILANPNNYWFQVIGRLKDGISFAQAQTEMPRLSEQIEQKYPGPKETLAEHRNVPALAPLQAAKVDPAIRKSFLILLAAVGLVLLIACANTANLLLARAVARQHEFAMRTALGAGRLRLIRQLITESMLLALLGGALGVVVARGGLELLKEFRPSDNAQFWTSYTRTFDFFTINLDWRVLSFNFALALLTGVLFGLFPAIQSSFANVNETLKEGAGGSGVSFRSLRRLSLRSLLVVGEIALSLVLLVGAGLMLKSLARLQAVNLGFVPENVVTMAAPSRGAKPEFYEQLLARVRTLPGVDAASIGSTAPLLGYSSMTVMDIEGRADIKQVSIGFHSISPDYFKTLGINLRAGRVFTEQDRAGAPRVAIISQAAAEKFFPGENPLGKRIRPYIDPEYETAEKLVEIVGVVSDVRYGRLEEAIEPEVYLSSLQPTDPTQTLIVRTSIDPLVITPMVRREVLALDRNVPLTSIQTMKERAAEVTSRARFIAVLLGLFAGLALLLSAIGIYGVMAYSVSARTRELGIRIALGAQAGDVLRLMLREGAALVLAGLALGLPAAWASLRVLQSQLYDMSTTDPLTFGVVSLLLASVALLACYVPARKAMRTDPLATLRYE
ncbi:MAG TPA: ABC transporter permease [Pyrinomonadaceae bacterium]|nr:ABC transporter permease [Pyrinomonadaceae bacterium]